MWHSFLSYVSDSRRVPMPTCIRSQANHMNAVDPVFLLALTEWAETAVLAEKLYNEETILVAQLDPSWLRHHERRNAASSAQRARGGERKEEDTGAQTLPRMEDNLACRAGKEKRRVTQGDLRGTLSTHRVTNHNVSCFVDCNGSLQVTHLQTLSLLISNQIHHIHKRNAQWNQEAFPAYDC